MPRGYLSLGSNLGDREENCRQAIERLGRVPGIRVVARSSCYLTEPVGVEEEMPDFVNLAVAIETDLSPEDLLRVAQDIEAAMGRSGASRTKPREIDLDILLLGDLVVSQRDLTIPHPRMAERRFVLAPMCEIAAELRHPVQGRTMSELLSALGEGGGRVRRLSALC